MYKLNDELQTKITEFAKNKASDNQMLAHLVTSGVPFMQAEKVLNDFLTESGLRDKAKMLENLIKEIKGKTFNDFDHFEKSRKEILDKYWGFTEKEFSTACKKAGVKIPTKINAGKRLPRDQEILFNYWLAEIVDGREPTKEALYKYAKEEIQNSKCFTNLYPQVLSGMALQQAIDAKKQQQATEKQAVKKQPAKKSA